MAVRATAAFSTQLGDLPLVELLTAAKQVRDVQQTPGWRLLLGLIEAHAERLQAQMLNASLPSYEQMAALAGELRGLQAMRGAAETVLDVAQEREAEAQQLAEASHGDS